MKYTVRYNRLNLKNKYLIYKTRYSLQLNIGSDRAYPKTTINNILPYTENIQKYRFMY